MIIYFTSTLSREDETATAIALMNAAVGFLDLLPIGYSLCVESSTGERYVHSRPRDIFETSRVSESVDSLRRT